MTDQIVDTFKLTPPLDDRNSDMGDVCQWLVQVMDKGDKALPFVVSVFSSFLKYGGLTDRQAESLMDVFFRVQKQFNENRLNIQGCISEIESDGPANVVTFSDAKKLRK
ncbi:hypothetical protein [Rhizobium sp. WCS2018Hpa-16]|uniref:hypothetical protein n=1 Tax=unclassified Rhizobium TaxID=2613769 RepID=UPI003904D9AA